jgi:hypothetical protein
MDVAGAQFAAVKEVDVQQTLDDLKASWLAQAKLDVDPSLVTLRLVKCGARKPTAEEEQAAVELDPFDTLAAAGITDSCKLLAYVTDSALCQRFLLYLLRWMADLPFLHRLAAARRVPGCTRACQP